MENKVFLDHLPKLKNGNISWKNCEGFLIKFIYNDIEGEVLLKEYVKNNGCRGSLLISYDGKDYNIGTYEFKKCRLGLAIGSIKTDYELNINKTIVDKSRNITIIGNERRKDNKNKNVRHVKYHCNKCGYESWTRESDIVKGKGCACCCIPPKAIVLGINTIYDTDPWMMDLGVSEEDAKKYTSRSGKNIVVKCHDCGKEKSIRIAEIYRYKSICCTCGANISYPEKFINKLLSQTNVDSYIMQLSRVLEEWCENIRYDFYFELDNKKCIIEAHGSQHPSTKHHNPKGFSCYGEKARTSRQELENDLYKETLARDNGIDEYIVIDCPLSNMEFIRNEILSSRLSELIDLKKIDWDECDKFATSNVVKLICDYWNQKQEWETTLDLIDVFNLSRTTIGRYLKIGVKFGWCKYNGEKELKKARIKGVKSMVKSTSKKVEMFDCDGNSIMKFDSLSELEEKSLELFGTKIKHEKVSMVCNGKKPQYKGFTFKYI